MFGCSLREVKQVFSGDDLDTVGFHLFNLHRSIEEMYIDGSLIDLETSSGHMIYDVTDRRGDVLWRWLSDMN